MRVTRGKCRGVPLCVAVLLCGLCATTSPCLADFDGTPTGAPSGQDPTMATDQNATCKWTSKLNPVPATLETGSDPVVNAAVMHALSEGGFDTANGWTVNTHALTGSFELDTYYAWVSKQPTITRGGITGGGDANGHGEIGGAAFALGFTRGVRDPPRGDIHWMQVIRTTASDEGGYDEGNGFHDLVDNDHSTTDPTYDGVDRNKGTANPDVFIDVPFDRCPGGIDCTYSASWRFITFIVTTDVAQKQLDIYTTGVQWGYDFSCVHVPEPSSSLTAIAPLLFLLVRSSRLTKRNQIRRF